MLIQYVIIANILRWICYYSSRKLELYTPIHIRFICCNHDIPLTQLDIFHWGAITCFTEVTWHFTLSLKHNYKDAISIPIYIEVVANYLIAYIISNDDKKRAITNYMNEKRSYNAFHSIKVVTAWGIGEDKIRVAKWSFIQT